MFYCNAYFEYCSSDCMETQQKKTKVLHDVHTSIPIDKFPPGLLPTSKQVMERLLSETFWKTKETISKVSNELIAHGFGAICIHCQNGGFLLESKIL